MTVSEIAIWLIAVLVVMLTLVLYIRVDLHDWGMVGFTAFMFGISVLMVRVILRSEGWVGDSPDLIIVWRLFVILGAPVALAGYILGIKRKTPPARQVARRLLVMAAVIAFLVFLQVT